MDFKAFDRDFKKFMTKLAPEELKKGLFRAASEMLHDADKQEPRTPFKKGDLRGSKTVEQVKIEKGEITVEAGFNIAYAARLHEMEKNAKVMDHWSLPGSGTKFLQIKMIRNKDKYIQIAANYLKRLLS